MIDPSIRLSSVGGQCTSTWPYHPPMETPGDVLKKLGMKGILTLAPEKGGAFLVLCDVDECYCPRGRGYFEPISRDDEGALVDWMPTEEHWPVSQAEHGTRTQGNIWLAHRLCNRLAGLDEERKRARAKKQDWEETHPGEFGNREAAEAQWREHSRRRQAHQGGSVQDPLIG